MEFPFYVKVLKLIKVLVLLLTKVFDIFFLQSFRGTPQGVNLSFVNGGLSGGAETLRQVEAKYPALLFKQQLTAYVEKIYGMIRDNLKKEISPLLGLCIQVIESGIIYYEKKCNSLLGLVNKCLKGID